MVDTVIKVQLLLSIGWSNRRLVGKLLHKIGEGSLL